MSGCYSSSRLSWSGRRGVTSTCWSTGAGEVPLTVGLRPALGADMAEAADPPAADTLVEVSAWVGEGGELGQGWVGGAGSGRRLRGRLSRSR